MITTAIFKSSVLKAGKRILKCIQYGPKTASECAPFGDDSNPLENMTAIYADTGNNTESIIIGYINKNQVAGPGEKRSYSLKPDKSISFYLWLRSNGTAELGGTTDNLVRYTPLHEGLADLDNAIQSELTKISTAISLLGGSYVPGDINTDISRSKIVEIKTI